MRPAAPGLFSTTTDCPSKLAPMREAICRAITSADPPGGNPTKIFNGGLVVCANAVVATTAVAATKQAAKIWRSFMAISSVVMQDLARIVRDSARRCGRNTRCELQLYGANDCQVVVSGCFSYMLSKTKTALQPPSGGR